MPAMNRRAIDYWSQRVDDRDYGWRDQQAQRGRACERVKDQTFGITTFGQVWIGHKTRHGHERQDHTKGHDALR